MIALKQIEAIERAAGLQLLERLSAMLFTGNRIVDYRETLALTLRVAFRTKISNPFGGRH